MQLIITIPEKYEEAYKFDCFRENFNHILVDASKCGSKSTTEDIDVLDMLCDALEEATPVTELTFDMWQQENETRRN